MKHATIEDLRFASEWCASYDPGDDDNDRARRDRVVAFLESEVMDRCVDCDLREIARARVANGLPGLRGERKADVVRKLREAYRNSAHRTR